MLNRLKEIEKNLAEKLGEFSAGAIDHVPDDKKELREIYDITLELMGKYAEISSAKPIMQRLDKMLDQFDGDNNA